MIITNDAEIIYQKDSDNFYNLTSKCVKCKLDPNRDLIFIKKLKENTRNFPLHMVFCNINHDKCVGLKRCCDSPEFIRREIAVAKAKYHLEFPTYNVFPIEGLKLRNQFTGMNCKELLGWESTTILFINCGNPKFNKNLGRLSVEDISDLNSFFYIYGGWIAFNYLLGVSDRKSENFIFSIDDQLIHSIDNEIGPFDLRNKNQKGLDIVDEMMGNIQKFTEFGSHENLRNLSRGYLFSWEKISKHSSFLSMFNNEEQRLLLDKLKEAPSRVMKTITC